MKVYPSAASILRYTFLWLLFASCAFAQAPRIELPPSTPTTLPRQTLQVPVQVTNTATAALGGTVEPGLPAGWRLLFPPEPLAVAPGESQTLIFSIVVPANAAADVYRLPVTFVSPGGMRVVEGALTVEVLRLSRLELSPQDAPAFIVAEPFTLSFMVTNLGNAPERVTLSVRDSLRLPLRLEPEVLQLEVGESREVQVRVEVLPTLDRNQNQTVFLTGQGEGGEPVTAQVRVELIPASLSEASAFHHFPLQVRLEATVGLRDGALDLPLPQVDVTGSGALWDEAPGTFTVRLNHLLDASRRRVFLEYRQDLFRVALGHQALTLSPLVSVGNEFGLQAQGGFELSAGVLLKGQAFLASTSQGAMLGLGATSSAEEFEFMLYALLPLLEADALFGARLRFFPNIEGLQRLLLDLDYALEPGTGASAQRLGFNLVQSPLSFTVLWSHTSAGFFRTAHERYELTASAQATLSADPSLRASANFSQTYELRSGEGAQLTRTFRADVVGRIDEVAWSLLFQHNLSEGITARGKDELRFSLTVPLLQEFRLQQVLGWQRSWGAAVEQELSYGVSSSFAVAGGSLTPELVFLYGLDTHSLRVSLGGGWSGRIVDDVSLTLKAQVIVGNSVGWDVSAVGLYRLNPQQELKLELAHRGNEGRASSFRFSVGLVYALDVAVPLGRRTDIAEVSGQLVSEAGVGLAGVVVRLSGLSTLTQADGSFSFPAVPAGTQVLSLGATSLGSEFLVVPALPYRLELAVGETLNVNLQVVRAASLQGTLRLVRPELTEPGSVRVGQGSGVDDEGFVRGVQVLLRSGDTLLRTSTDSQGAFRFATLMPGSWELTVVRGNLPENYRLEPLTQGFELSAGELRELEVQLIPVVRAIRMQEGGTVGSP